MSTFGTMTSRIMDEMVLETGLTSQIQAAILSSIKFYERERFYFNERLSLTMTFSTGQELYTATDLPEIATIPEIDQLTIFINASSRYPLTRRTWEWINRMQMDTTGQGQPTDYCQYAQQIRAYPIPSGVFPAVISGTERFAMLSADGDTNAWMTDAEELIRYAAKKRLAVDVLHDAEPIQNSAIWGEMERDALRALRNETVRRLSSGRIVATCW
jgi:hypothetical protein